MIRVVLLALLGYLAYRVAKRWVSGKIRSDRVEGHAPGRIDDVMVKDPQCGAYFARRDAVVLRHRAGAFILQPGVPRQVSGRQLAAESLTGHDGTDAHDPEPDANPNPSARQR